MNVREQAKGAVVVFRPEGALAADDADELKMRLMAALETNQGRFVLDGSGLTFVDSRGLEVLAELADEMRRIGRSLRVCALSQTVAEVLELTGVAPRLECFADANAAVRSFL
jgi:anti-anti-sigma factor